MSHIIKMTHAFNIKEPSRKAGKGRTKAISGQRKHRPHKDNDIRSSSISNQINCEKCVLGVVALQEGVTQTKKNHSIVLH